MEDGRTGGHVGFVGRVPVRNLWLLIFYASELFRSRGPASANIEENPDDVADLVAESLAHAVEQRQRRDLSLGYRSRNAVLKRLRGRIDIMATERYQWPSRGKVACRFDEVTIDTARNRYVRGALESIHRVVKPELAHRCRKLATDMKAMGVLGSPPSPAEMSADRFGRHHAHDRFMVEAAKLAFDLALRTETPGKRAIPRPNREEAWVRRLFERAVGGFFDVVLTPQGWEVNPGTQLAWQIESKTPRISGILPGMRADIVLDHPPSFRRIVVDTKFNSLLTSGWYRKESVRSAYVYQIYAYLRSQVGRGDPSADRAEGVLLHPAIGETIDETVVIQEHPIRFATIDLTGTTRSFRERLPSMCRPLQDRFPNGPTLARNPLFGRPLPRHRA